MAHRRSLVSGARLASLAVILSVFFLFFVSSSYAIRINYRQLSDKNRPEPSENKTMRTFKQKCDHFDASSTCTFQQRYTVDATHWNPAGGPVFFFLSGEAAMEDFEFQEVQILNWAAKYNALYVVLEHRQYGKSLVGSDFSLPTMKLLSSEQALEDAAQFLLSFNASLSSPSPSPLTSSAASLAQYPGKWIVFGCSYSAALSAWFRLKYPQLVIASVAPSGPVEAQANFTSFYTQFQASADATPYPGCASVVSEASKAVYSMLQTPTGRAEVSKIFNSCEEITEESSYFFQYCIQSQLGSADQFQNPDMGWPLNATCQQMTTSSTSSVNDYIQNWANLYGEAAAQGQDGCFSFNGVCHSFNEQNFIKQVSQTANEAQDGSRSWFYQSCSEFGFFGSSYPGTSVFFPDVDVDHQIAWCEQVFGVPNMAPNTDATNARYGGKDHLTATNVLFTNGMYDPWHHLSVTQDLPTGPKAVTYDAGHCASLTVATPLDPPSLIEARAAVDAFLGEMLQHK